MRFCSIGSHPPGELPPLDEGQQYQQLFMMGRWLDELRTAYREKQSERIANAYRRLARAYNWAMSDTNHRFASSTTVPAGKVPLPGEYPTDVTQ